MRSKIAQQIMDETPEEVKIFVRKYGDLVVCAHQVLKEKGITQKELAKRMDKTPSEISKWLSGDHNFTLRSIAKLEAELGVDLLYVSKKNTSPQRLVGKSALASRNQRSVEKKQRKRRTLISQGASQRRKP